MKRIAIVLIAGVAADMRGLCCSPWPSYLALPSRPLRWKVLTPHSVVWTSPTLLSSSAIPLVTGKALSPLSPLRAFKHLARVAAGLGRDLHTAQHTGEFLEAFALGETFG